MGGNITNEGRLEICLSNVWGTVCDNGWSTADAAVACGQFGYAREGETGFGNIIVLVNIQQLFTMQVLFQQMPWHSEILTLVLVLGQYS